MRAKRFIVYDVETNGGKRGFIQPVEIFAGVIGTDGSISDKFHVFLKLRDGFGMNPYVSSMTGISELDLKRKGIDFMEGMISFLKFINNPEYDNYLCGHNIINSDNIVISNSLSGLVPASFNPFELIVDFFDTAAQMKAELLAVMRFNNESFRDYHKRVLGIQAKGVRYSMYEAMQHYSIKSLGISHRADGDVINCVEIMKAQVKRIQGFVDVKTGEIIKENLFNSLL